jgi:hypothetical protein
MDSVWFTGPKFVGADGGPAVEEAAGGEMLGDGAGVGEADGG